MTYFDGGDAAAQETLYDAFRTRIEGARSQKTMLEMSLDTAGTRIEAPDVRIGVHISPVDTLIDAMENLMLVAVLFEDSIAHPGFSGDTVYVPIVRDVIGGAWGVPVHLRYATEFDTVLEATLGNWREGYMGVAVFVQDTATKQVLQSVIARKIGN